MAETLGAVAAVVALAQLAFESSVKLHQLVKSFAGHNSRVRELEAEVNALCDVLHALGEHVQATKADVSMLVIPLKQCNTVCADFSKEIMKCSSNSDGPRTSFRSWMKLKYMGDDIDGFRRLLASYKLTITVALSDANLKTSTATAESVETYHDLLQTTQEDLRDRLQAMDEKIARLVQDSPVLSNGREVKIIQQERLSTEKCLEFCAELSSHINELRQATLHSQSADDSLPIPPAEKIYNDGLQECAESLSRTAEKLASCEDDLLDRMLDRIPTMVSSEEERATLSRLRDELNATRQSIAICAKAHEHLREEVATIENHATGDAIQLMVSNNNKPIHGKNRGLGWRTRQLGGYVDNAAVLEAIRSFSTTNSTAFQHETAHTTEGASDALIDAKESPSQSRFNGTGFSLASHPAAANS